MDSTILYALLLTHNEYFDFFLKELLLLEPVKLAVERDLLLAKSIPSKRLTDSPLTLINMIISFGPE